MVKLLIEPVRYFRSVESSHVQAAIPFSVFCVATSITSGIHMRAVVCNLPIPVSCMIGVTDTIVKALMSGLVVASFLGVAKIAGGSHDRGRLVKCLLLSYWIYVPVAVALIVESLFRGINVNLDAAGWSCIQYGDGIGWVLDAAELMNNPDLFPYSLFVESFNSYCSLLVIGWQSCALRVVSKCSLPASIATGAVLGLLFVIVPWSLL